LLSRAPKLTSHRLKPGGVQHPLVAVVCSEKLKCHRLKPGGVQDPFVAVVCSEKLKCHRLKPGGVQDPFVAVVCSEKLKYHRLKPGGVRLLPRRPAPAPDRLARDALVNFLGKTLNYLGSEKRSVAINDC
jgi:hypothetical protein